MSMIHSDSPDPASSAELPATSQESSPGSPQTEHTQAATCEQLQQQNPDMTCPLLLGGS